MTPYAVRACIRTALRLSFYNAQASILTTLGSTFISITVDMLLNCDERNKAKMVMMM